MYNITITISSDKDINSIASEISALVERTTGERCRISFVNRREQRIYNNKLTNQVVKKLGSRNNG